MEPGVTLTQKSPRDSSDQDDRLCVRQALGGDYAAFERLIERFQTRVYNLARRILGQDHDAEDVTQQTFLSVLEHMGDYRGDASVAAWVLRIAANHALKLLRKRRGLATVSLVGNGANNDEEHFPHPDVIAPWQEDPVQLAERREVRALIEKALADLDDKHRLVFVLRDIEGFSVRETADLLNISEANVKVRLLRARLALREALTRELGDPKGRVKPNHNHE